MMIAAALHERGWNEDSFHALRNELCVLEPARLAVTNALRDIDRGRVDDRATFETLLALVQKVESR